MQFVNHLFRSSSKFAGQLVAYQVSSEADKEGVSYKEILLTEWKE